MKRIILVFMCFVLMLSSALATEKLPLTKNRPLMLLPDRLTALGAKYTNDHASWTYLRVKADMYKTRNPESLYNPDLGRLAAVEAFAYLMTDDTGYRDQAIAMLWARYFDSDSTAYWDFTSRNGFRSECLWAAFVYDWLYDELTATQKAEAQAEFVTWGNYWISYIGYPDYDSRFDAVDSDEATSLTANMLFLAMALYGDNALATDLFDLSDGMLNDIIVSDYMNGYMKGGVWAEGSGYSQYTQRYWALTYLINKESRGISYPNTYMQDAIKAVVHMTIPGDEAMYMYGDLANIADNYPALESAWRFDLMAILADGTTDDTSSKVSLDWLSKSTPPTYNYYGAFRFLFEKESPTTISPESASWATSFLSDSSSGQEFVDIRTGWGATATDIMFRGAKYTVDHVHQDTGTFAISRNGVLLTKEKSGYQGVSADAEAHNSFYIENPDLGNPSPTLRPAGYATTVVQSGTGFGVIKSEMQNVWNMEGYWRENPLDLVRREIVFIYPDTFVISDFIIVSSDDDCTWIEGNKYAAGESCDPRSKKMFFHFLSDPTETSDVWSATQDTEKITFQMLSPSMTTTKVDESVAWSTATEAQMPTNQRLYHLEIVPAVDQNSINFISVIQTMSSTGSPASATLITGTNTIGAKVGDTVSMFTSAHDAADITVASYTVDATTHYIADLPVNTLIDVSRAGTSIITGQNSGNAGVIKFTSASGSASYVVTAGDSSSILPPSLHPL